MDATDNTITTRNHDEYLKALDELTQKAAKGTLTRADLDEAMRYYYDDRDFVDRCFGTTWICQHPRQFARYVPDVLGFILDHLKTYQFVTILVLHEEVMEIIPSEIREDLLFEMCMANWPFNDSWIKVALKVGIPESFIRHIIRSKFDQLPDYTGEKPQFNSPTLISNFLEYGMGYRPKYIGPWSVQQSDKEDPENWQLESQTPWSMFSDGAFYDLCLLCTMKDPTAVLRYKNNLAHYRLGREQTNQIVGEAISHMPVIHLSDLNWFADMPLAVRQAAVSKLKVDEEYVDLSQSATSLTKFLMKIISELPQVEQEKAFQDYKKFLEIFPNNNLAVYRAIRHIWQNQPSVPRFLYDFLEELRNRGKFVLGTVRMGSFRKPGSSYSIEQAEVRMPHRRAVFVQDRFQHDYRAKEGEEVIIFPDGSKFLTSGPDGDVRATHFVPLFPKNSGDKW